VHAAGTGHLQTVRFLLDHGADPDVRTTQGGSALYWAASNGHREVAALLLERGVAVNVARDCGWTPLTAAIYNGHEEIADLLLGAGANPDHRVREETMYQWAVRHGRERIAKSLSKRQR
jgi:ankyrin repeat protein